MNLYCSKCGGEALYNIVTDKLVCFDCDGDRLVGKRLVTEALNSHRVVIEAIEKRKEKQ